jgi:CheY-like chemotaxis protein
VAVLNSNDEIVELLRSAFEQAGMTVVSAHVDAIRRGKTRLADFIQEHDPSVIVYDVVPPYDRSWRFLDHIRSVPTMHHRQFVLTSPNADRARELSGDSDDVFEVVGKPYDVGALTDAVKQATRARPTRG